MPSRAAFMPSEESKVVSSNPRMLKIRQLIRAIIFASLLTAFSAAAASAAFGQALDFTLSSANGLQPPVVQPGGTTSAVVSLQGTSPSVTLSCTVTSTQTTTNLPTCAPSPLQRILRLLKLRLQLWPCPPRLRGFTRLP